MNQLDHSVALWQRATLGNAEAKEFLLYWLEDVHAIDDIIDGDRTEPEQVLSAFALAASLFSHPFYLRNIAPLRQMVFAITNTYADSVAWERSTVEWRKTLADHARHCGH